MLGDMDIVKQRNREIVDVIRLQRATLSSKIPHSVSLGYIGHGKRNGIDAKWISLTNEN